MGMRGWILPVVAGSVLVLSTACSGGGKTTSTAKAHAAAADSTPAAVMITPANAAAKVRPDNPVTVAASSGKIQQVTLQTGSSAPVAGQISADGKSWQNTWNLKPGASYTLTAMAKNAAGKVTTQTSSFTTLKAASTFHISDVTPAGGETVGIGMPIMVTFDSPISDRAAVEKSLELKMSSPVEGAWHWLDNEHVDFLARHYWTPHSTVTFDAHLTGVRAASGMYGTSDVAKVFKIGESHITKVNARSHHLSVTVDGQVVKNNIPISAGTAAAYDLTTTSGVHLSMARFRVVEMTSSWMGVNPKDTAHGGYDEMVPFATQIDDSGEYIHQTVGDEGCLGVMNCSHGCVRSPESFASWFYGIFQRGDVDIITGTSRQLPWDNGWGFYQMPWSQWVAGSALKTEVNAGASASPAPSAPATAPPSSTASPH